ncbi:unnamed protein product [Medioppia subpectinata]|uniref:Uncharacterized protein n=1 Tax=Medioppia subpectinata TaxID=1979941 RepID=A0A7R9KLV2_9ACAR|nr:unnamed protein product [Medioppia subpectinata]CAG2105648.1 unnamed protein product [Medioppia subpectinata]
MVIGVYDIITCLQDNLQDVKQCTPDRQEVIFSMIRQVSGRTMDVFCGEYNEGSDKCDKLEKPPKKLKSQRRTKSFAIPIIDVLKGFPETNKCETGWLKRFDSNVARLLTVGNSGRKFPEQRGSELEKFCSENDRLIKVIEKQRNDCMLDMPKQITGVLIYAENKVEGVQQCSADNIATLMTIIRSVTGNTVDVFCGDYTEESDKCNKLGLPPRKLKSQRRTKSFAVPMIDVLQGFPEV